jgi:NAD(P)-dependent dehydrogenase (short-subunit alcohol dehydrogenase family)
LELARAGCDVVLTGTGRAPQPYPFELWQTVINVNLNGTFYMSRAFGRAIAEQDDGGAIVNISLRRREDDVGQHGRVLGVEGRHPRPHVCDVI